MKFSIDIGWLWFSLWIEVWKWTLYSNGNAFRGIAARNFHVGAFWFADGIHQHWYKHWGGRLT